MFSLMLRSQVILLGFSFNRINSLRVNTKSVEMDSAYNFIKESNIVFSFFSSEVFMRSSY